MQHLQNNVKYFGYGIKKKLQGIRHRKNSGKKDIIVMYKTEEEPHFYKCVLDGKEQKTTSWYTQKPNQRDLFLEPMQEREKEKANVNLVSEQIEESYQGWRQSQLEIE